MRNKKVTISRLHEIRCGNPSNREENMEMAETLIDINNSHQTTVAYHITCENGHEYVTLRHNVATWEKLKGSLVIELVNKSRP